MWLCIILPLACILYLLSVDFLFLIPFLPSLFLNYSLFSMFCLLFINFIGFFVETFWINDDFTHYFYYYCGLGFYANFFEFFLLLIFRFLFRLVFYKISQFVLNIYCNYSYDIWHLSKLYFLFPFPFYMLNIWYWYSITMTMELWMFLVQFVA